MFGRPSRTERIRMMALKAAIARLGPTMSSGPLAVVELLQATVIVEDYIRSGVVPGGPTYVGTARSLPNRE